MLTQSSFATTRLEIADAVEDAFEDGAADLDTLLAAAHTRHASREVLLAIGALPARRYQSLRDLWPELPGVPVERS